MTHVNYNMIGTEKTNKVHFSHITSMYVCIVYEALEQVPLTTRSLRSLIVHDQFVFISEDHHVRNLLEKLIWLIH